MQFCFMRVGCKGLHEKSLCWASRASMDGRHVIRLGDSGTRGVWLLTTMIRFEPSI